MGTSLADLKVSLVVVLVLNDALGHLEVDVAVKVALGLREVEDEAGARGVDEQPSYQETPVYFAIFTLRGTLAFVTIGKFVGTLDEVRNNANQQICSDNKNQIAKCVKTTVSNCIL